jgi:hypothetical protein
MKEKENRPFLPPFLFANKGLAGINLGNILLKLWFHLISKITLFLSFHIPILYDAQITGDDVASGTIFE